MYLKFFPVEKTAQNKKTPLLLLVHVNFGLIFQKTRLKVNLTGLLV